MSAKLSVVTLDGPAGVGKTTLARRLAENLGLCYLDTGAMFRSLAIRLGPDAAELSDNALRDRCRRWTFTLQGTGTATRLFCNDERIGNEIRTEAVGMLASKIARLPVVREVLSAAQRSMGERFALVAEGRDMGTVVFPDARYKFFLDASAEVRALRRMRDEANQEKNVELADLTEQIRRRDAMDRNRAIAPLRPAEDALIIDTSEMDINEVLGAMLHHISINGGMGDIQAS